MLTRMFKLIIIIASVISLSKAAFAQQNQPQNKQDEPQWVEHTGFKGKIFDIKNRNPRELVQILQPLGSGFKGAIMQPNSEYKTITVRDFPENINTIEEAIKRLDVPLPPKPPQPQQPRFPDVDLFVYVLIASNDESAAAQPPPALADVIKQLQVTLSYKNYQLLTSIVQRTRYDNGAISANGTAQAPDKSLSGEYQLQIQNIFPENRQADSPQISLGNLQFSMRGYNEIGGRANMIGDTRINTKLSVRDGEKVVVGTASLKDKAVILVLTTRILK
jgi:Bacterial type II/III secretion system short domain